MTRVLVTIVTVLLLAVSGLAGGVSADAAPTVRVTASATAPGTSAADLVRLRHGGGSVWRGTGRIAGTWLQTSFSRPTTVDATRITGAGAALRIADARLLFSDGSVVAVHTTAGGSRYVPFAPRKVRWVRLIVSGAAAGQKAVGLHAWTIRRGVAHLSTRPVGDAARFASARTSSGHAHSTSWMATRPGTGQWLELRWKRPVEMSAVQIAGGAADSATAIRSAALRFSDGSTVAVGTLEPRGGSPTTIAFTARSVTTVRLQVTSISSSARAALERLSVYAVGARPPVPKVATPTFRTHATTAQSCSSIKAPSPTSSLVLLCPSNGSSVSTRVKLVLSGPANAAVTVSAFLPRGSGGSVDQVATGRFDSRGTARVSLTTRKLAHGPTAVRVTAAGVGTPLYVQMVNRSGVMQRAAKSLPARGLDLKYDEQFTRPLSVTRSGAGAQYASGKPNSYGTDDFGDAIFAQPRTSKSNSNLGTMPDGYLRIRSTALRPGQSDPAGYGRRSIGGMVSSAHLGGSGFSAQYGYFEVRMLGPAGAGTWPAFWLLSTGSLYRANSSTAEVDAVELYGEDPAGACQTTHNYVHGRNVRGKAFCGPLRQRGDFALRWHTYGAKVTPTGTDFYIDGMRTVHTSAMVNNDQSFFFMVNLALGGGWPVNLSGTHSQVDLFVDSVRVWI